MWKLTLILILLFIPVIQAINLDRIELTANNWCINETNKLTVKIYSITGNLTKVDKIYSIPAGNFYFKENRYIQEVLTDKEQIKIQVIVNQDGKEISKNITIDLNKCNEVILENNLEKFLRDYWINITIVFLLCCVIICMSIILKNR